VTGESQSATHNDFVKVAHATDEAEAELVQGLLRTADVGSVVRRAPDSDVPGFLAAGPREVLVAASDVPLARDVLREVDPGERGTPSQALPGVLAAKSGREHLETPAPSDTR
jgi:Putative prokaryotic signal transducing protein